MCLSVPHPQLLNSLQICLFGSFLLHRTLQGNVCNTNIDIAEAFFTLSILSFYSPTVLYICVYLHVFVRMQDRLHTPSVPSVASPTVCSSLNCIVSAFCGGKTWHWGLSVTQGSDSQRDGENGANSSVFLCVCTCLCGNPQVTSAR